MLAQVGPHSDTLLQGWGLFKEVCAYFECESMQPSSLYSKSFQCSLYIAYFYSWDPVPLTIALWKSVVFPFCMRKKKMRIQETVLPWRPHTGHQKQIGFTPKYAGWSLYSMGLNIRNLRTLAAPGRKGVTGVALATSQHLPASGSGWDIPASKRAAHSMGHKKPRPQGPAYPQRKPVTACPQLPLPVRSWALKVSLSWVVLGICPGTGPSLALELTEATNLGP